MGARLVASERHVDDEFITATAKSIQAGLLKHYAIVNALRPLPLWASLGVPQNRLMIRLRSARQRGQ